MDTPVDVGDYSAFVVSVRYIDVLGRCSVVSYLVEASTIRALSFTDMAEAYQESCGAASAEILCCWGVR